MMTPLFVLPFALLAVLASFTSGDEKNVKSLNCLDHNPIMIGGERERLVATWPVTTKSWGPAVGKKYPENGLVKPPRLDTQALSPAGMPGGKAPFCLAAHKSRPHAP
jgi:hypothetical protein